MSDHDAESSTQKPKERRSPAEWAIYSLYLPPIVLAIFMLYYFIVGLLGH